MNIKKQILAYETGYDYLQLQENANEKIKLMNKKNMFCIDIQYFGMEEEDELDPSCFMLFEEQ